MSFSDFFVASDADLSARNVFAADPYDVDIFKLPCKPSVDLPDFQVPYVVMLLGNLAGWSSEQVEARLITLAEVPRDYGVLQLDAELVRALAAAQPQADQVAALLESPGWSPRQSPWDDAEYVLSLMKETAALAAEAERASKRLCWWWADSVLFK